MNKKLFSEKSFSIDLISDAYNTVDPVLISKKLKEDLNINLSPNEILDYLNYTEDYEKESYTISMKYIF